MLKNKKITLIVTGSIAAYKACDIVRALTKKGACVRVVMTEAAQKFITPLTFETLTHTKVATELFDSQIPHIHLAQDADLILVAPATGNTISKAAAGIADNLATSLLLARKAKTAFAPAMNEAMWLNATTLRSVNVLLKNGVTFIGPQDGDLACGARGTGRMVSPDSVVQACEKLLSEPLLSGKDVLITAGPTFEAIDPVRGITNRSSGKQGYALAKAAYEAGANVTLISGPTALETPFGVRRIAVESADEMLAAVKKAARKKTIFISVAAVVDWKAEKINTQKIKKGKEKHLDFSFVPNPDIVKTVTKEKLCDYVVGFAAETQHIAENAKKKLAQKGLDLVVANKADATFGKDTNSITLITKSKVEILKECDKLLLARKIIEFIAKDQR